VLRFHELISNVHLLAEVKKKTLSWKCILEILHCGKTENGRKKQWGQR